MIVKITVIGIVNIVLMITKEIIMKKLKRTLKVLYIKWIMGQCRHLCCVCKFHNQCFDNFEDDYAEKFSDIHTNDK